jgi:hypothetical protein
MTRLAVRQRDLRMLHEVITPILDSHSAVQFTVPWPPT